MVYLDFSISFSSTTLINGNVGTHDFNLPVEMFIPVFLYGNGYVGGFGMFIFRKNGNIFLLAYSNGNMQEAYANGTIEIS